MTHSKEYVRRIIKRDKEFFELVRTLIELKLQIMDTIVINHQKLSRAEIAYKDADENLINIITQYQRQ